MGNQLLLFTGARVAQHDDSTHAKRFQWLVSEIVEYLTRISLPTASSPIVDNSIKNEMKSLKLLVSTMRRGH